MKTDKQYLCGVWYGMMYRCYHPKATNYNFYGGRGIAVCDDWRMDRFSFIKWAIDHGYSRGLKLDRINNDGDYCPDNCRFITHKSNCRNRRNTSRVGSWKSLVEVCEKLHVFADRKSYDRIRYFIKRYGGLSDNIKSAKENTTTGVCHV